MEPVIVDELFRRFFTTLTDVAVSKVRSMTDVEYYDAFQSLLGLMSFNDFTQVDQKLMAILKVFYPGICSLDREYFKFIHEDQYIFDRLILKSGVDYLVDDAEIVTDINVAKLIEFLVNPYVADFQIARFGD